MERIQQLDDRILSFIQRRLRCSFLDFLMPIASASANFGGVWLLASFALICTPRYWGKGIHLFVVLSIGALVCNLGLKPYAGRLRPCHMDLKFRLLVRRPPDYSFPSGHTLSSFAASLILLQINPAFGAVAFSWAIIIAFSRMYLFVHYPSDVLAAALMGLTMPWSALVVLIRLHRRVSELPALPPRELSARKKQKLL